MITIGNIFHTNPAEFDEVWIICFSVAEIQELFAIKNVRHVPELAPREELFWIYRTMVHANQWNKSSFEKYYVPRFLKDIQNSSSIKLLKKLVSLSKKEDIRLACFCTDEEEHLCHRSIVAGILFHMGADIECKEEYRVYRINTSLLK